MLLTKNNFSAPKNEKISVFLGQKIFCDFLKNISVFLPFSLDFLLFL